MSTADRMKAMRERRRKAGHVRREYYATPDEHERIKQLWPAISDAAVFQTVMGLLSGSSDDAPHEKQ